MDRFLGELRAFLAIPSVSTEPRHADDVRRCASWVVERLREIGMDDAAALPTEGHPIVLARWLVRSDAPTVLVYGHYDVQPSAPDDRWSSPPFRATERGERIYARGAADDKGQVHMHLKAIETLRAVAGELPVNVTMLLEGEEEVGSPNLAAFVAANRERLACDAVVISDTTMLAPDTPCITVGMRGLLCAEITVSGPDRELHSGHYGGVVANPANALSRVIAGLHDAAGRITVPGFYDRVRPLSSWEIEGMCRVPPLEDVVRQRTGAPASGGEAGVDALTRNWFRPALDVNGLRAGFDGAGVKTIIPPEASAKVSMRLVADQDPDQVADAFARHVRDLAPQGVTVDVQLLQRSAAWSARPDHPAFRAAEAALSAAFGAPPIPTRVGGSIPIVPQLAKALDVPLLLLGFSLPDSNIHAPDESLHLGVYRRGIVALATLYRDLGPTLR